MRKLLTSILISVTNFCFAQQAYYPVTAGEGNGVRFWYDPSYADYFKIHMGNGPYYHYGPVTDYSIKTNMNAVPGRGWTWGGEGAIPVAALNIAGNMQIAGSFSASTLSVGMVLNSRKIALWDDPVNWYGIGIQGGQVRMQVGTGGRFSFFQGDNSEVFTVKGSGEVGIGTTSPGANLEVVSASAPALKIRHQSEQSTWGISIQQANDFTGHISAAGRDLQIESGYGNKLILGTVNYNTYGGQVIFPGGNVGIGTNSPNQKLTVNGTIYGKEVKVDLSVPGPDYVFEKSYSLPTLEEVKSYIDQNKHLPEVPSAREMEKNGVMLGEMNMLLLKKVEELTLYIIEQEKRISALEVKSKK